jgi:amino acid permease
MQILVIYLAGAFPFILMAIYVLWCGENANEYVTSAVFWPAIVAFVLAIFLIEVLIEMSTAILETAKEIVQWSRS